MGLNVGGIHVRVVTGVTQRGVAERIEAFWTAIGATKSEDDALDLKPLSLATTGELGFVVLPEISRDDSESEWIPVYDSERYTADPSLARYLAEHFKTDVWFWEFHDATDQAYAKRYGANEQVVRGDAVEDAVSELPGALLYFNHLKKSAAADALAECITLRFAKVPHRPKAKYSGPSPEQLDANRRVVEARELAAAWDAEGLAQMADIHAVYWEVIKPAVEGADLRDAKQLAFACALGPVLVSECGHDRTVAEAALRAGDEALFAAAMEKLAAYEAGLMEAHACRLGKEGEEALAFRLLEAVTRHDEASQTCWNNAIYYLFRVLDDPGVDGERLEALLAGAGRVAPTNPFIFHNLACVYAKLGRHEKAIEAVHQAKTHGYEHMDAIATDEDLASLRSDPRFAEALDAKVGGGIAHLVIERAYRKRKKHIVRPAIGLHLAFEGAAPVAPQVAEVFVRLRDDFPEMFAHYRPSGILGMERTKKGKVARDITALRKNKSAYGFDLQYDDAGGEATERRVRFEHDDDDGMLSLYVPLALADDPDALFDRLVGYASETPFVSGAAGYTLCPFDHGPVVGPGTDAQDEIRRLAPAHLGLAVIARQLGYGGSTVIPPSWLTFVGRAQVTRLGAGFREALGEARVHDLDGGALVIRAAHAPFVGRGKSPTDLGALPAVARALAGLLPEGTRGWALDASARCAAIAALD
jgi:hypothetical protein